MTYDELLQITAKRKAKAIREINKAIHAPGLAGVLAKAELEKKPGSVAWLWLAKDFCETLADHVDEFMEQAGIDSYEAREIANIYMAYEDSDDDLYSYLPIEAQLFTEE